MPVNEEYKLEPAKAPIPVDADIYQVIITDVNMNKSVSPFDGLEHDRLEWNLQILDEGKAKGHMLKAWTANKWFTNNSTGIKSGLYALAEGVFAGYGTKIDMDFGLSFNPNDLIGKQVRLTVGTQEKAGVTSNKIQGYMPIKKELPKI
jgi:hypothetical protein